MSDRLVYNGQSDCLDPVESAPSDEILLAILEELEQVVAIRRAIEEGRLSPGELLCLQPS